MNRHERRRAAALGTKPRRKIWIAVPCYGGTVHVATMRSLMHDMMQLIMRGDMVYLFTEVGHADIYLARAQIVNRFLEDKDATDLVMVDSDVSWQANGILDLIDHPVDLVAGSYPKRDLPIRFMLRTDGSPLMADTGSGLAEVWGMPGGFMRCTRAMLEKMVAHYGPELTALDAYVPSGKTVRIFDPWWWTDEDGDRRVLSEDYAFCQRWREIGGKVYVDVQIMMGHVGQYEYVGKLGEFIEPPKASEAA